MFTRFGFGSRFTLGLLVATSALAVAVAGCVTHGEECQTGNCLGNGGTGNSGNGGTGGSGAAGGGGNGGGGVDPGCIPSDAGDPVEDTCGVFVSSSLGDDDAGDGTKDAPYATVAVAAATGMHVYACAETFDETEGVALAGGQSLFGGLDCADAWKHGETKTALNGPADTIALVISGNGSGRVEDMAITAADAVAAGGSSIAVLVDGSKVDFARCDLTAGDGADGSAGDSPDSGDLGGTAGDPGVLGCEDTNLNATPEPMQHSCVNGGTTKGGRGGIGDVSSAFAGTDGISDPMTTPVEENGGKEQTGLAGQDACDDGELGADGATGQPGAGASGQGEIGPSGHVGSAGQSGQAAGVPGQGGGGGGGTQGQFSCDTASNAAASGGNGGSGGCGGDVGAGGAAGGSSIALISLDSVVTASASRFSTSTGGDGGVGSDGEPGGVGGLPGDGGANDGGKPQGCDGGQGGGGGRGGAGGGGLGGHSLGIAHTGTAPTIDDNTTITPGTAGSGGTGGDGGTDNQGGDGDAGQSAETLSFDR